MVFLFISSNRGQKRGVRSERGFWKRKVRSRAFDPSCRWTAYRTEGVWWRWGAGGSTQDTAAGSRGHLTHHV